MVSWRRYCGSRTSTSSGLPSIIISSSFSPIFVILWLAEATKNLTPKIARACRKSIGTPDPGAVSMTLIVDAASKIIKADWCAFWRRRTLP
ncbi:MAG: DAK2 domain-containing protein [Nitrosomonas sp.]|nr:DAK2 domain-containing protein [Nitrosomonas sp.]